MSVHADPSWSAAELLHQAWLAADPALVGWTARERLDALARSLPRWFDWFALECRLDADDDRVDYSAVLTRGIGDEAARRDLDRGSSCTVIDSLAEPTRAWLDGGGALQSVSPLLTYEIDVTADGVRPFAYLCVDPAVGGRHRVAAEPVDVASACADFLAAQWGTRAADACRAVVECVEATHGIGRLVHIGGRTPTTVAACISTRRDRLDALLHALHWPGHSVALQSLLALLHPEQSDVMVQLLLDAASPALGLEVYFPHDDVLRWSQWLGVLVAAGLATRVKVAAALRWLGESRIDRVDATWPATFHRGINAKVSVDAEGRCTAKVYLGFSARTALF